MISDVAAGDLYRGFVPLCFLFIYLADFHVFRFAWEHRHSRHSLQVQVQHQHFLLPEGSLHVGHDVPCLCPWLSLRDVLPRYLQPTINSCQGKIFMMHMDQPEKWVAV